MRGADGGEVRLAMDRRGWEKGAKGPASTKPPVDVHRVTHTLQGRRNLSFLVAVTNYGRVIARFSLAGSRNKPENITHTLLKNSSTTKIQS